MVEPIHISTIRFPRFPRRNSFVVVLNTCGIAVVIEKKPAKNSPDTHSTVHWGFPRQVIREPGSWLKFAHLRQIGALLVSAWCSRLQGFVEAIRTTSARSAISVGSCFQPTHGSSSADVLEVDALFLRNEHGQECPIFQIPCVSCPLCVAKIPFLLLSVPATRAFCWISPCSTRVACNGDHRCNLMLHKQKALNVRSEPSLPEQEMRNGKSRMMQERRASFSLVVSAALQTRTHFSIQVVFEASQVSRCGSCENKKKVHLVHKIPNKAPRVQGITSHTVAHRSVRCARSSHRNRRKFAASHRSVFFCCLLHNILSATKSV